MNYDFKFLRDYLQGQIDLGVSPLLFDEPWAIKKPSAKPLNAPKMPQARTITQTPPGLSQNTPTPSLSQILEPQIPTITPRAPAKKSLYESVENLKDFYQKLSSEILYKNASKIFEYQGPAKPKLLLLIPSVQEENFFGNLTGETLLKLFSNYNIAPEEIGVTYFYKAELNRTLSPILEAELKKMLVKELSFIQPEFMVSFGEPLYYTLFGRAKKFMDEAGVDLNFSGTKTCALVDAYAMAKDKQLKWVTWKMYLPRSTYFKIP